MVYDWMRVRQVAQWSLELTLVSAAAAGAWLLSTHVWYLAPGDVELYRDYALGFWSRGSLPTEYPPLAVLPFSLTLFHPHLGYAGAFGAGMGVFFMAGYAAFRAHTGRGEAVVYAIYILLGAPFTVFLHYDIVPALAVLAALWALGRHHYLAAYVLLALGTLLKLYPAVLLPVVAIEQWRALAEPRRAWPVAANVGVWFGIVAAVFVLAAISVGGTSSLSSFLYVAQRPVEVESPTATLAWAAGLLGLPVHRALSYGSFNVAGGLTPALQPLALLALLVGCLWIWWKQAYGLVSAPVAFLGCLGVLLLAGKVFSPQFLVWLLPIAAAVQGLRVAWLSVALLTTLAFPILFLPMASSEQAYYPWPLMTVLAIRNLALAFAVWRLLAGTEPAQLRGQS